MTIARREAFHGLTRSLIQNMVVGVKNGYEKKLEIVGVGYIASIQGDDALAARRLRQRDPQESSRPDCRSPAPIRRTS